MFQKRILALFLSTVLLAVVLSGCGDKKQNSEPGDSSGNSSSGAIIDGGEIVVGIAQDLGESLDPYQMTAAGTREVLFNVYEGLIKPTKDSVFVPAIASEVQTSDDGLTLTFPLREGVLFHNGDPVTVNDVIKSFETCAATTVEPALAAALSGVQVAAGPDENTVVITLPEASNDFLSYAASVYIVPANYTDQKTAPVGTGPFKFVSRSVQENVILERFDDYWGDKAHLEKVTCQIYEDTTAMMNALSAGAIDMVNHLTVDQAETVKGDYNVLDGNMNLVQALYLNNAEKPFDNEQVRQAMCWAIDVDEILNITENGHGTKIGTSIYPNFKKYYDASLADTYGYDVEKAKELLTQAGYPDGFSMTITVPSNYTPHKQTAEVIVEQLAKVGITASINLVEWETWVSDVYGGRNFQSTVVGFDAATLSAGALLDRWVSDNGKNMINYNNPEYDDLMAKAAATSDDSEQTKLYKQAAKLLADTAANVYIQDLADFVALRNNLAGYEFYPLYVMDFSTIHQVG